MLLQKYLQGLIFRFQAIKTGCKISKTKQLSHFQSLFWVLKLPQKIQLKLMISKMNPGIRAAKNEKMAEHHRLKTWPPVVQENVCDPKGRVHGEPLASGRAKVGILWDSFLPIPDFCWFSGFFLYKTHLKRFFLFLNVPKGNHDITSNIMWDPYCTKSQKYPCGPIYSLIFRGRWMNFPFRGSANQWRESLGKAMKSHISWAHLPDGKWRFKGLGGDSWT